MRPWDPGEKVRVLWVDGNGGVQCEYGIIQTRIDDDTLDVVVLDPTTGDYRTFSALPRAGAGSPPPYWRPRARQSSV